MANLGETMRLKTRGLAMADTTEDGNVERWTLRDQAIDFGLTLAAGFAVAATIGCSVGVLTDAGVPPAVGFAIISLGVLCLLSAGLTGGQYAAGGVGRGAARHMFVKESFLTDSARSGPESGDRHHLLRELSEGYRAEKDPIALRLGIGGILYVAAGFAILVAGS